jgi:hypothetical protein
MRYTLDAILPERAFKKSLFKNAPATLEGGGGSAPAPAPSPTQTTVTNTSIPEYARPYTETMLGATQQQLFNMDGGNITGIKPYVPYSQNPQDYFAGFSPLQQRTQQNIANMQVPGQYNQATGLATQSGQGALGTTGQANMYGAVGAQQGLGFGQKAQDPNAVQGYMNPYLQNALQPQLAEIQRQYDITGTQQAGQATQAGAFGGGRDAIMAAENARNKNTAMNQAIGQGYNTAFNNAQGQMANAAQLGMQGAGIGLQGVGAQQAGYSQAGQAGANLANIGGQQLQAQQGIYGLQNQVGAQQQAAQQDIINQQIQNYAVAQQYPQQQLSFMNAMLRGLPMQSGTTQMYQAQPSAVSQAAGLGTAGIAGLGLYNTMNRPYKEGGVIKSYASGGVADIDKRILLSPDKYSVQQIQNGMQNGVINKLIGDPVLADKIKERQMASAPQLQQQPTIHQQINQQAMQLEQAAPPPLPMQQPQGLPNAQSNLPTFNAYDGGIVAFGGGGSTSPAGTLFSDLSPKEQLDKLRQIEEQKIRAEKLNPPKVPVSGAQPVYATGQNIVPPEPVAPQSSSGPSFGQRLSSGIDSLKNMFNSGPKKPSPVQMSDVKSLIKGPSPYLGSLAGGAALAGGIHLTKEAAKYLSQRSPEELSMLSQSGGGDDTAFSAAILNAAEMEKQKENVAPVVKEEIKKEEIKKEDAKENPLTIIRDPKRNVSSNTTVVPKAPVVKEETTAPVLSDGIADLAASNKTDMADLKNLILGQSENSDKQLKINSLLALANAGFGMAGGTSPNAITNIAAGGAKGIESLSQAVGQHEAAKARQIQQLVSLGLKGQELNQELQKLGITKAYYDMHAPLFAAQANYYNARAANPPGSGSRGGVGLGLLQPGKINMGDLLKLDEKFDNLRNDKGFISSLDPTIQAQLQTKPGSPSYNAGVANVNKIIDAKKNEYITKAQRYNATYKVPQASFFSSED